MEESNKRIKTVLVVLIFVLIIIVSMYIVISKAIKRNENNDIKQEPVINDTVLNNSKVITELSLDNKKVIELYNYVNDNNIDYLAYKNESEEISTDLEFLIVSKQFELDKDIVEKDSFDEVHNKIFGKDFNIKSKCGLLEDNYYKINTSCLNESNIKIITFLKNITLSNNYLKINKYYAFIDRHFDTLDELSIYSNDLLGEDNLIASGITMNSIGKYIDKMNIMSYLFKSNKEGGYYLVKVVK